jgi:hypothetical protein
MLVQPALTTHLLCRPVSIADSMVRRWELQVLCGVGTVWYVLALPHLGTQKTATPSFLILQSRFVDEQRARCRTATSRVESRVKCGMINAPCSSQVFSLVVNEEAWDQMED